MYSRVSAQYEWIRNNVCTFSKNPPDWFNCKAAAPVPTPVPTPTLSPIQVGLRNLLIVVTLDSNPTETGWRLTILSEEDERADEDIIIEMPVGSYDDSEAGATFQYDVTVNGEKFYNMTIYETMGNGFGGTVLVSDLTTPEMSVLIYEPGFTDTSGTIVSHGFYVGFSPAQFLTLNLVFDVFPNELAFCITNDDDGTILALAWFGTFDTSYKSATAIIPIYGPSADDRGYTLRIWDSNNDGICCQWGDGRYDLYLGDPNVGGMFLGGGSGNYGAEGTFPFVIMGDSSLVSSVSTPLPSSFIPMIPSTKPTLRPADHETPQEDPRVPTLTSGPAPTLKPLDGVRPMKDDVADDRGGALNESDAVKGETIISAAAYDTSSSTMDRICHAWSLLVIVYSFSWLINN